MMDQKGKILIIEDQQEIAELIAMTLKNEGYTTKICNDGLNAIPQAKEFKPHLILLDLMLPRISGEEICRQLKNSKSLAKTPVVIISAKNQEEDIVQGYEYDIQDYITKPFSTRVLKAKINNLFKSIEAVEKDQLKEVSTTLLVVRPETREVLLKGDLIQLTKSEFDILHALAKNPRSVFSRKAIVDAIRGKDFSITERSVDFQIVGLRRKLGPYKKLIETVRGSGYRYNEDAFE